MLVTSASISMNATFSSDSPPVRGTVDSESPDGRSLMLGGRNSVIGKTYLIQTSTDLKSWSDLAGGFPDGGATSDSTLFTTPKGGDPGPYYLRVVEE